MRDIKYIKNSYIQDPFGDILRVHWLLPIWAPNGKVSVLGENCPFGHNFYFLKTVRLGTKSKKSVKAPM